MNKYLFAFATLLSAPFMSWGQGYCSPMYADNAGESNIRQLWSTNFRDADAPICVEDQNYQQFNQISDGSYRGLITTGDEKYLTKGRLFKYDDKREKVWTCDITPGESATALFATSTSDGTTYVTGDVTADLTKHLYIAKVLNDGSLADIKIIPDAYKTINVQGLYTYNDAPVVTYISKNKEGKTFTGFISFTENLSIQKQAATQLNMSSNYVTTTLVKDHILNVIAYQQSESYSGILVNMDITKGTIELDFGNYYAIEARSPEEIYTITYKNISYEFNRAKLDDNGKLINDWTTTTTITGGYHQPDIFLPSDGSVWLYDLGASIMNLCKFNPTTGEILSKFLDCKLGGASNSFDWVYDMEVNSDGNLIFIGMDHTHFNIFCARTDKDLNLLSSCITPIDYTQKYSYIYRTRITTVNGKFVCSGFMRPNATLSNGTFPFFAIFDGSKNNEAMLEWNSLPDYCNTINVTVYKSVMDSDDNTYLAYKSYNNLYIAKYNKEGEQLWRYRPDYPSYLNVNLNGLIVNNGKIYVGATMNDENYVTTVLSLCLDSNGNALWTNYPMELGYSYDTSEGACLTNDSDGNLIFTAVGYDKAFSSCFSISNISADGTYKAGDLTKNNVTKITGPSIYSKGSVYVYGYKGAAPVLTKYSDKGVAEWIATKTDVQAQCVPTNAAITNDGHIVLVGYSENNGFYMVVSPEGNITKIETSTQVGYWSNLIVNGNNVYMVGQFVPENGNLSEVIVSILNTTTNEIESSSSFQTDNKHTYAKDIFLSNDLIAVVGHASDGIIANKYVVLLDTKGNVVYRLNGEDESDSQNKYSIKSVSNHGNKLVTCAEMPVNQSIKRASITAYEILNNSGVNIIEFNKDKNLSPIVSTEYYDLAGHRISSNGIASGIYLKVNHHADGTITSEKRIR